MNAKEIVNSPIEDLSTKTHTDRFIKFHNMYIASQPNSDSWEKIKALGVKTIINLRAPEDTPSDEIATIESLGMKYMNVPVPSCNVLTIDQIRKVNACISEAGENGVLVHCKSANRASSWLAVHLYFQHDVSPEDAVKKAQEVGLTAPGITQETIDYLDCLAKS